MTRDRYLTAAGEVIADPLTAVTRKERRNLIVCSAVGLLVSEAGLLPTKISALGVDFDRADQGKLALALGMLVAYFLLAFVLYAFSDFLAWRIRLIAAIDETMAMLSAEAKEEEDKERRLPRELFADEAALRREQMMREVRRVIEGRILFAFPVLREQLAPVLKLTSILRAAFEFLLPLIFGYIAFLRLMR